MAIVCLVLLSLAGAAIVLVRTPEPLAHWLVETHPELFKKTYQAWARDTDSLAVRWLVRALSYKLSRDWITAAEHEVRAG